MSNLKGSHENWIRAENRLDTNRDLPTLLIVALAVAGVSSLFFGSVSHWAGVGLGVTAVSCLVFARSSTRYLAIPAFTAVVASIYFILAPLASVYYVSDSPIYRIHHHARYFSYAVPAVFALFIGWQLPLAAFNPQIFLDERSFSSDSTLLRKAFDRLLVGGTGAIFAYSAFGHSLPPSAGTALLLLANTRFIGATGWILLGSVGWRFRILAVLTLELAFSLTGAFFLNFLLWAATLAIVFVYRHRPSSKFIVTGIVSMFVLLPSIQYTKWSFRNAMWGVAMTGQELEVFGTTIPMNSWTKPPLFVAKLVESTGVMLTGRADDDFIAETIVRYNQGWIVDRVMTHVPRYEPFAGGGTIADSAVGALVPRFLMPNKVSSGGASLFTRYTGVRLNKSTSMNLGILGEMYANFGLIGGVFATMCYGVLFGLLFCWLVSLCREHPIRLVFIPYILNWSILCEVSTIEVFNQTAKSMVIAVVIVYLFPCLWSRESMIQRRPRPSH